MSCWELCDGHQHGCPHRLPPHTNTNLGRVQNYWHIKPAQGLLVVVPIIIYFIECIPGRVGGRKAAEVIVAPQEEGGTLERKGRRTRFGESAAAGICDRLAHFQGASPFNKFLLCAAQEVFNPNPFPFARPRWWRAVVAH